MAEKLDPVILTFGGGINRRRRPFDIDPQECYDGQNFDLDHQFSALHRRNAFQLIAAAPNSEAVQGYAQLTKRDGTITTLIQAGGNVYSWNGETTFTLVGTCSAASKLRGTRDANFPLDDVVFITDLEKLTEVQQWDGTAFASFVHNLSSALYAKYCKVHNERAYFANVRSGTDTPHVILGSELSEPGTLTVTNRPSSSLSAADPFFIPSPDLKPINGLEKGFGVFVISTENGQAHVLAGSDATDFALDSFYPGSAVSGDEALLNIGNDIIMGLPGRIETLSGTDQFGDVETDDVSSPILPLVEDVASWTLAYDQRLQKVYCFPNNQDRCWVLHKSILAEGRLSPWSKWVTDHDLAYRPTCVMQIADPTDGLPAVYMGDNVGRIFKMEGATAKDGGSHIYIPEALDFNGTTARLSRGANLTGAADTSQGIMSIWIKPDADAATTNTLLDQATNRDLRVHWDGVNNRVDFNLNLGGADALTFRSSNGSIVAGNWYHILASWDTNFAAGSRLVNLYVDDVSNLNIIVDTGVAFSLAFATETNWHVAVNPGLTTFYNGCISEYYFAPGQYLDFSTEANRRLFISEELNPVSLDDEGSAPTGTAPLIYFKNQADTAGTNSGTGGNFTISGTIEDCVSNPTGSVPSSIDMHRRSVLFRLPSAEVFDISGSVAYLKGAAADIILSFEYGGETVFDQEITISIPAATGGAFYNDAAYYGGNFYYNTGFQGRLHRRKFTAAGRADYVQINIHVHSDTDIEIHEVTLNFRAAES